MRTSLSILALLFHFMVNGQKKLNAETFVKNVTIFSSGARVERSASITLQAGRTEISFAGLSNQLDQETVQLMADANIVLLTVQSTRDFLSVRKIEQEEKDLIAKSAASRDKIDLDGRMMEVFKNEETMLVKNQAIGGQNGVKAVELKESLDLQRQRLTEIYSREQEIQKQKVSDQHEFDRTNLQLEEISKKKDSVSYIVTALVESKIAQAVNFNLLYNVKDAGWFTTYDIRVNELSKPLSMMMNANVFQRSGETWKDVSLLLSTGDPNNYSAPSQLQTWFLRFYNPPTSMRMQPASSSLNEVVVTGYGLISEDKMSDSTEFKMKKETGIQTASITTQFQPTTTLYKIDDKYSIETDGKMTTIGLKNLEIPVIYNYYSTPKLDPSAFLTAKMVNWQDYNLQSGEVSLYFEGTYLGKTFIDLSSASDTLSLSLGKDNGINISRKLVREYSTKKFIGSNHTESRDFEISLRNTKTVPITISVLDQIPVSTSRDITVDDIKVPEAQLDKESGIATWIITIPPGQDKKLRIGFSIKYPKDRSVVLE